MRDFRQKKPSLAAIMRDFCEKSADMNHVRAGKPSSNSRLL